MKNGRLAMILVSQFIQHMPPYISFEGFCLGITAFIRTEYEHRDLIGRMAEHPEERLTASAIIYSKAHHELWMAGDCQALVDGVCYDNIKPYEETIACERVRLISQQGYTPQEARRMIEPMLVESMKRGQNIQYAVIDGFPIHLPGVKKISISNAARQIVLATDGYPFLKATLKESEEALARQLKDDPQNLSSYIATKGLVEGNKSFDDRAYIRISLD